MKLRSRIVAPTLTLCVLALTTSTLGFAKTGNSKASATYPTGFAVSKRVLDMPIERSITVGEQIHEPGPSPLRSKANGVPVENAVIQREVKSQVSANPGASFSGIPSPGYVPSDSNLAVSPTQIVETVNVEFAVYNKSGATLAGPTSILSLFTPLGGVCGQTVGDPVVLYDRAASRWLISMIGSNGTDYGECIAVSKTSDATGAYYLWGYASFGSNLNDYPKLSTWATTTNSAYLATYNIFSSSAFNGADLCGFDRTKMLAGNSSPAMLCQMTPDSEGSYLPGDMDGPTPPVNGTPGLFITWQNNSPGQLYLRKLTLNFASGTSTLSSPTVISVADDNLACGSAGDCIPQEGTTQVLDSLGDRMMYRFAIRHFSDHDRAVVNHAVGTTSGGTPVAVRWYELYDPAGSVTLNQQGIYAPDSTYRWMASLAEDQMANIGMGYSASSSDGYPAIRFTGRVPTDTLGTMEGEYNILTGSGAQVGSYAYRWGDYTAMQVDPADDCTFWYVDQYQAVTGTFDWSTNISSFIFNTCNDGPSFSLSANPNSLTVSDGGSTTTAISVAPANGFDSAVTLSATSLPSGLTASFNPNPATSTSTMTVTAPASLATGNYTLTVSGVGTGSQSSAQSSTQLGVTVTGAAGVTLSASSLAWTNEVVGETAAAKTLTLDSTGAVTLNITSIVASGDFAITSNTCGSTLPVNKKCTVKVTFTPSQLGTRTGFLSINDNIPGSPQTVPLSGVGTAQTTLTPASETFASTKVGASSAAKNITLANKQNVAVTGISASTTGDFTVSSTTCGSSLGAKSSCTVSVVFKPTQTGALTGTLQINDSAFGSPQTTSLTGTGK